MSLPTLLVLSITLLKAQTPNNTRFEVEVDPIAYALNGYSLHGILVHKKLRFDVGVFGIKQPDGYSGNKGFSTYTSGYGLKVNYLFGKNETWFSGVGLGYSTNHVTHQATNQENKQAVVGVGVHIGYRWFMFKQRTSMVKNLYLGPWASLDFNTADKKIAAANQNYIQPRFSIFPTVHIGYKF
jgi:hypothetical protein